VSPQRLDFDTVAPDVFKAMVALHNAARRYLDDRLVDLILIRASQINQCTYCLDMHIRDARKHGESDARIFHLGAWAESPLFSEKEKAVLAFTEAVTVLTDGFVSDDVYLRVSKYFDESQLAGLIAMITCINAWNRINVATRKAPRTD
jgi:AhpD family alkylhydroperoxidase